MPSTYVDPADLHKLTKKDNLNLFHLNVRSVKNKTEDLELLFNNVGVSFDVIMFSETWYNKNHLISSSLIINILL